MVQKSIIIICAIVIGIIVGIFITFYTPLKNESFDIQDIIAKKQVIGFLPYWLVGKAKTDYSSYLTTFTYFGLNLGSDGSILKLAKEQEEEPGWNTLSSGKLDSYLSTAKKNNVSLSLLVFNGDNDSINELVSDPVPHANQLVQDAAPIMKKYGFTDLNLDIESVNIASDEARMHFTQFIRTVKEGVTNKKLGTLTVEVSGQDLIKKTLIDPKDIGQIADYVVVMAYDFHYIGSYVTGAVAPLGGAGVTAEYDTQTALQKALEMVPSRKLILGIPLYGYEWETIDESPHSAVLPGSGLTASTKRVEDLIASCTNCTVKVDTEAQESYVTYPDADTGTFHQIFYPTATSTQAKIDFARKNKLGGLALWALGYESNTVMEPLRGYK